MIRFSALVISACILAACSGNPFDRSEDTAPTPPAEPAPSPEPAPPGDSDPDGIEGRGLPPGTSNPTPNSDIVRFELRDNSTGPNRGNGFANGFRYEPPTSDGGGDLFYVEGLAFDGDQPDGTPYTRARYSTTAPTNAGLPIALGTGFAAYESPVTVEDTLTGQPIPQLQHLAVFKRGTPGPDGEPLTELAIVRTGSYSNYGFGGFIYQRNGNVVLPTQGQAKYVGDYAGLRDFSGVSGIEYATGRMDVSVDFNGFSGNCSASRCTDAVRGSVEDRRIFDTAGQEITNDVIAAINTERNASITSLPVLRFTIGTGVLDRNGEIVGTLDSNFVDNTNRVVNYEQGNYYAIMAGDHTSLGGGGGEIVGIIVVEGQNSRVPGSTFRETGGFIVTREPAGP
ncbi:MAG: hypothetical protein ACNA7O_02485 [Rhodobacterales bacterium]